MSDAAGTAYRPVHYIAGVCTALYMKEAVEWAAKNGGATGENVKKGFYQKKDWVPAGMEGVCNPSTWTEKDHRGTLKVDLYRMKVAGATDAPLNDLVKNGGIKLEKVKTDRPAAQARVARLVSSRIAYGRPQHSARHPRESGDPVRRGFSVDRRRLWNTGSPAFAGDDGREVIRHD